MKKVISLTLTVLMLTAILHLSVAYHYCGGDLAASKISFSGKLASCGMEEGDKDLPFSGLLFSRHCCENVLATYGINSIFFPSFSSVPESHSKLFLVFLVPVKQALNSTSPIKSICTNVSPPGALASSTVDLTNICVYRI
ncbi:MAG: hypothetical protein WA816_10640 [Bacteroidales bacterium]